MVIEVCPQGITVQTYGNGSASRCENTQAPEPPWLKTAMFFGSDDFGEAFGYVYSFCMIGMVLGSPFLALVYDKTGSYNLGWVTCEIMCVLSILCIVYAVDRMYKETEKTGSQE